MKKSYKQLVPDPKFQDQTVAKFINYIMKKGKKAKARKIVYQSLSSFDKPIRTLKKALTRAGPDMEVTSRRIGGANYQVPRPVNSQRSQTLAMRWIIEAARQKKGAPMHKRLAQEIKSTSQGEGAAIKKKENTHRMAAANKAFAHFAR